MTEDYKKNTLDYITNTLTPTDPDYVEVFKELIETPQWAKDGVILPVNGSVQYEGMIAPNELTSNLTILYGGWYTNGQSYGIITLVDVNFNPIKSIFEYDSGTPLRYIHFMGQDEDGSFYLVDDTFYPTTASSEFKTSEKRFVMVSNFSVISPITNDYSLVLRKSYIFANQYRNFYCRDIFKNPNSSHYLLIGSSMSPGTSQTPQQFNITSAIDLKVNVGEENEWAMYSTSDYNVYGGAFALFNDDDEVTFNMLTSSPLINQNSIYRWYKSYSSTSPTLTTLTTFDHDVMIDSNRHTNQSVFTSFDTVYFVCNNQKKSTASSFPRFLGLYKYDFIENELTTISEQSLGTTGTFTGKSIYITSNNGIIYAEYNTNINIVDDVIYADYYVQRIASDIWSPILVASQQRYTPAYRSIFVKSNFNLLQYYLYSNRPTIAWYQVSIKEDFNANNYNSTEYVDYNSLVPQKVETYSNNSLVFARNITNNTINENQSNATTVIPSSYLNNIDITQSTLYSETNTDLVDDENTIQKNIYETLYLNFINTINVIDEDTNTNYPNAASYITSNINIGTENNCNSTSITKVRINQKNNTQIISIVWEDIDDTHKKIDFNVYVQSPIISIDLMSNDESTVYMSIDATSLETGNTYNIIQYIRIE